MGTSDKGFEGWFVVEQMGHKKMAGYVREVEVAGAGFLRIDIPGDDAAKWAATQFIQPSTIYALTPVSEEVARAVAKTARPEPVHPWEMPALEDKRHRRYTAGEDDPDDPGYEDPDADGSEPL